MIERTKNYDEKALSRQKQYKSLNTILNGIFLKLFPDKYLI